ncbi:MAG: VCBS repeat-containing protein [Proteobacteria bacterium]|nr:VCBS repeat-containing protein [Pseudomonadota bacterium]
MPTKKKLSFACFLNLIFCQVFLSAISTSIPAWAQPADRAFFRRNQTAELESTRLSCGAGELCVLINTESPITDKLLLILYKTTGTDWPQQFLEIPAPDWIIKNVPSSSPERSFLLKVPLADNIMTIAGGVLDGAQLGLAVVDQHSSMMTIDPQSSRGFSSKTLMYQAEGPLDFGSVELKKPSFASVCDLNRWNPACLSGGLFFKAHSIGAENSVPGAIYMDLGDLDHDGISDIVAVGQPHFNNPLLPLTELKLGVYYMNADLTLRDYEMIDQYSNEDPQFYSPWGVKLIEHSGQPMIIVGTGIPGLAPLKEGKGNIYSYSQVNGKWARDEVFVNPNPNVKAYSSMIGVPCDIDQDGDDDLVLSGSGEGSAVGSWLENSDSGEAKWPAHLKLTAEGTDPNIRGTLAYTCKDINHDGNPDILYNALFNVANSQPQRYRGEIWLAINPGKAGKDAPWQRILIDGDNWASADMLIYDFDHDGNPDIVANQLFDGTMTLYTSPGGSLETPWHSQVIASGMKSASDMWLADMDADNQPDIVIADHTGHRGLWFKNPGPGPKLNKEWSERLIFDGIKMPGDFVMNDIDHDGDLDWIGTSLVTGQPVIVEQVKPERSLVLHLALPENFTAKSSKLFVGLYRSLPVAGPPDKTLLLVNNLDLDHDGYGDVDQILNTEQDFTLGVEDVGLKGTYYVYAVLYVEGGGQFLPLAGVDSTAVSKAISLGSGQIGLDLQLK